MTDDQLYALLVWVLKAAGGVGLVLVVYAVIRAKTPEFPEDDGEMM